jgi:hypothetical protein
LAHLVDGHGRRRQVGGGGALHLFFDGVGVGVDARPAAVADASDASAQRPRPEDGAASAAALSLGDSDGSGVDADADAVEVEGAAASAAAASAAVLPPPPSVPIYEVGQAVYSKSKIPGEIVEPIEEGDDAGGIVIVGYVVRWKDSGRSWLEEMRNPAQQLELPAEGKRERRKWNRLA